MTISKAALFAGALLLLAGCGGSGGIVTPPTDRPTITVQPLSQTIPIGRSATFTVSATGTAPLSYQWSENDTPIPGATGASYTTPAVDLSADGSTSIGSFQVIVSNSVSSVASAATALTAGPRTPALGDLRYLLFDQVTAAAFFQDGGEHTNVTGSSSFSANNALGTPPEIGTYWACYPGESFDCAYVFDVYDLPPLARPVSP
jgi:hypothetical protein